MMQEIKDEERLQPEAFCYWLQGFFEMSGAEKLNKEQTKILKEHLELVFRKVPNYNITATEVTQTEPLDIPAPPLYHEQIIKDFGKPSTTLIC